MSTDRQREHHRPEHQSPPVHSWPGSLPLPEGRIIRPFVGGGLGTFRHTELTVCEVPGCDLVIPSLPLGKRTTSHGDIIAIVGASTMLRNHVVIRGGVQFHNLLWGEELSLFETSVGFGYRF